jgi:CBS domain-containing protein
MASVEDVLQAKGREVWTIGSEESVAAALSLMREKNIGALVVVAGETPVGLLSERDFARGSLALNKGPSELTVSEVMSEILAEVERTTSVSQCMRLMTERRVRHLPVKEGARIVGIVSIGDVVNVLLRENESIIRHLEGYIAGLR